MIRTVGVKRKGFGTSGTAITVHTNHFAVKIPTETYFHYDGEYSRYLEFSGTNHDLWLRVLSILRMYSR